MTWAVLLGVTWLVTALLLGCFIGRSIRLADQRARHRGSRRWTGDVSPSGRDHVRPTRTSSLMSARM
jgi:hypothetical protein